jgi:hypothetical protein
MTPKLWAQALSAHQAIRAAWAWMAGRTLAGILMPALAALAGTAAQAQPLTSQGPTGVGLVPTALVQRPGAFTFDYSNAMPGAPDPKGHNFLFGMGLTDWLEVNMRLATNTVQCDWYNELCYKPGEIRDLSGSFKLQVPMPLPRAWGLSAAVGAVDVGGAASFFTSHYAVLTRRWTDAELSVGMARGQVPTALLEGPMVAFTVHPWKPLTLSVQQVHGLRTAHAVVTQPIPGTLMSAYIGGTRVLSDTARSPTHTSQWAQLGLSMPLGGRMGERSHFRQDDHAHRTVRALAVADLLPALRAQKLGQAAVRRLADGSMVVAIENTHFPLDVLDALGVALGVLAGLPEKEVPQVTVEISSRGLPVVQAQASVRCLREWLEHNAYCGDLEFAAMTHRAPLQARAASRPWWSIAGRPDVVLTPLVSSTIGTEVGAFDADFGVNANLIVPLWKGASFDYAYNFQLEQPTKAFRKGGLFADSRLLEGKVRHMMHQVLEVPQLNTYLRASVGTGFAVFEGRHFESLTTSTNGRHRLALSRGSFYGPYELDPLFKLPLLDIPRERTYRLARYRYAWDDRARVTTEVTTGKFFNGDEGTAVLTRFHHGDASYAAYIRRSKMPDRDRPVAFAGFQFSIPLTFRRSVGPSAFSLRGTTDFQYSIESKVGERDNLITRSYGEVPLFGEHLARLLNRDRNGQAYFDSTRWRIRDAFLTLTRD